MMERSGNDAHGATPSHAGAGDVARNAAVVGGATMLSRVLGYARDLTVAFTLGAGPVADAFFVAFRLPNLLRRLFGEGSLTMSFVPVFIDARRQRGDEAAFAMARSVLFWLAVALGAACVAVLLAPRPVVLAVAPGFAHDPDLLARTAAMVRITFPYALFICGVALCMGVLNSMGSFLGPALAPALLNVCLITAALGAWLAGGDVALALCWGVLAAGVLQWLLQQPFLRRAGFAWRGPWSPSNADARAAGRMLAPMAFGAAAFQATVLLGTVLASLLDHGAVSHLYYADRLVQLPLGVFAVAVGTAALPGLSALSGPGDEARFARTLRDAVSMSLFMNIPAAAGLIGLSRAIVSVLFERGAFSPADSAATAAALSAYALGLPALAAVRPLVAAFQARRMVRPPVAAAFVSLGTFAVAAAALTPLFGHVGIALAVSVAAWANCLHLARALKNTTAAPGRPLWPGPARMAALSVPVGLGAHWATLWGDGVALLTIPLWIAAYLALARVAGVEEARRLPALLRGRR